MPQTLIPESFGFNDLARYVLGDVAAALSDGEPTEAARAARADSVMAASLGLFPSDVGQMMVAGQAVMFHALTARAARRMLSGVAENSAAGERSVISMGRAFTTNLNALIKLRGQAVKGWLTPPPMQYAPRVERPVVPAEPAAPPAARDDPAQKPAAALSENSGSREAPDLAPPPPAMPPSIALPAGSDKTDAASPCETAANPSPRDTAANAPPRDATPDASPRDAAPDARKPEPSRPTPSPDTQLAERTRALEAARSRPVGGVLAQVSERDQKPRNENRNALLTTGFPGLPTIAPNGGLTNGGLTNAGRTGAAPGTR